MPDPLDRDAFVARFGHLYEASPWVAEAVWPDVPADRAVLAERLRAVVDAAPLARKLALIRAHPELGSRARMAEASAREQASVGLDACSAEELAALKHLNEAYRAKFGFPFVLAIKGLSRQQILAALEARRHNDAATEIATALTEIHRIARLRLDEIP